MFKTKRKTETLFMSIKGCSLQRKKKALYSAILDNTMSLVAEVSSFFYFFLTC